MADIETYPVFPVDDSAGNLHPLWFWRSFLSLFHFWLFFHHFHFLNNVVCQLTAAVIKRCIPV